MGGIHKKYSWVIHYVSEEGHDKNIPRNIWKIPLHTQIAPFDHVVEYLKCFRSFNVLEWTILRSNISISNQPIVQKSIKLRHFWNEFNCKKNIFTYYTTFTQLRRPTVTYWQVIGNSTQEESYWQPWFFS